MRLISFSSIFALLAGSLTSAFCATFTYNPDGQLTRADYGGASRINYAYDDSGSLLSSKGPSPLELWRFANWSTLDSSGSAADATVTDGITNLLRFGIGATPGNGLSSRTSAVDDTGASTLTVTWWARNDMPSYSLKLETETAPGVWTAYSGTPTTISTSGAYTQYEAVFSYSGSAPHWRLTPVLVP